MRIVLATCGALLVIGGVWTAAFTAVGSADQPAVIGPAVVVGSTSTPTPPGPTTSRPSLPVSPSESEGDDDVRTVQPSSAVQVTDDHGGRGKGKDH